MIMIQYKNNIITYILVAAKAGREFLLIAVVEEDVTSGAVKDSALSVALVVGELIIPEVMGFFPCPHSTTGASTP